MFQSEFWKQPYGLRGQDFRLQTPEAGFPTNRFRVSVQALKLNYLIRTLTISAQIFMIYKEHFPLSLIHLPQTHQAAFNHFLLLISNRMGKPKETLDKDMALRLSKFQDQLLNSKNILALVGAGLSASSGLSTFRGSGGLWRNYSPIDLATPSAFDIDPSLVWQFYSSRRYHALKAKPNMGHFALAELRKRKGEKFLTLTQNVDGLSQRAGHSDGLLELHGSLFDVRCTGFFCNYKGVNKVHPITDALAGCEDDFVPPSKATKKRSREEESESSEEQTMKKSKPEDLEGGANTTKSPKEQDKTTNSPEISLPPSPEFKPVQSIPTENLPRCPECKSSTLRPGIVWFGESLPLKVLDQADDFLESHKIDLVLVIGTSGTVWPAMGFIERAKKRGAKVAVFNTEIEDLAALEKNGRGWGFQGDAAEWLPRALEPVIGSGFLPRNWKKL
ncbi:hypothetical protein WICPIJ_006469 [Wickerhamomyces pijperi]|uniref:NAD-dependent protein deacylase n=1 Tax=Wickerhamomyces pijperi TaxID=599730 RepID=A0A9P8Q3Q3_WICPI|nr:hypothetical protein WICPIJ_006469 [Wickerhamomyces pijperi]